MRAEDLKGCIKEANREKGSTFSLIGDQEAEQIEGVEVFKHLKRMLYQSYNNYP